MTKQEAVKRFKEIQREGLASGDFEHAHGAADDLLVTFVRSQGFRAVAEAYKAIEPKYCA